MPAHRITIGAFKIDRTEVTNAQFAEFMNALPVKPIGTALGGKVGPANIAPADGAMFLEFSSRPSPYTMIDLDDDEARIGVATVSSFLIPGTMTIPSPRPPGPALSRIASGAVPVCRPKSSGRRRPAACRVDRFPGAMSCRHRSLL